MCPHTLIICFFVSALILLNNICLCVLIPLCDVIYMLIYVSSYRYICVVQGARAVGTLADRKLICFEASYAYVCPHTPIYMLINVSSYPCVSCRGQERSAPYRICFEAADSYGLERVVKCITVKVQKCAYCARQGETLVSLGTHTHTHSAHTHTHKHTHTNSGHTHSHLLKARVRATL